MMRLLGAALLSLSLGACGAFVVADPGDPGQWLGKCYDGGYTSFCVVRTPPGTAVVMGSGFVPVANNASGLLSVAATVGALK